MALIEAEAGVVLETPQAAAEAQGLMLPVDLGAHGSCTIATMQAVKGLLDPNDILNPGKGFAG